MSNLFDDLMIVWNCDGGVFFFGVFWVFGFLFFGFFEKEDEIFFIFKECETINSMNKSNRWYATKNLLTKEEREKEGKEWGGPEGYLYVRMSGAR